MSNTPQNVDRSNLAATVFVEMAVQKGLRTPDGEWISKDTLDLLKVMREAYRHVSQMEIKD